MRNADYLAIKHDYENRYASKTGTNTKVPRKYFKYFHTSLASMSLPLVFNAWIVGGGDLLGTSSKMLRQAPRPGDEIGLCS